MIIYNPKDWWKLILGFQKSDTFRIMLPGIAGMALYTAFIVFMETEVLKMGFRNTTSLHAVVGFVLSMLLVFRTNTAYDRWWEGRKLWGGFVNQSRNLAIKISVFVEDAVIRERFRVIICNYIFATKEHLREGIERTEIEACDKYSVNSFIKGSHIPNNIQKIMLTEIYDLVKNKKISHEQLLFLNEEFRSFADQMGACERIKKTPIPYSYNIFLKKIIFIYIASMPFGFAMEFGYWSIMIVPLLFYVFGSIELIAEEIEDPFGRDDNDLPTDQISTTIRENLLEILQ
jgi:putative membrane protein